MTIAEKITDILLDNFEKHGTLMGIVGQSVIDIGSFLQEMTGIDPDTELSGKLPITMDEDEKV